MCCSIYLYLFVQDACSSGLVMWLPAEKSDYLRNGLVFSPRSHLALAAQIADGSWANKSMAQKLSWYSQIARSVPLYAPEMELGDAVIFNKCKLPMTSLPLRNT